MMAIGIFLSSTSLGNSGLSAEEIESRLQSEEAEPIRSMLEQGTCLPLYFDGDCALDKAVIVYGELSPEEDTQWCGVFEVRRPEPCPAGILLPQYSKTN